MSIDNITDVSVRIPEFILYYGLKAGLDLIESDYIAQSDKSKSLLGLYLKNVGIQRYQFMEQAVKVFVPAKDEVRKLTLNMMYNREKENSPSIYITMPTEQSTQNTLGFGEGIEESEYTDIDFIPKFTRRFQTTYSLVITSDNDNEVILIYHVIRALIISMNAHFALAGFQNLKLGGTDLKNYNKEIPNNLCVRSINLSFEYETNAVDFNKYPQITDLIFSGTPFLIDASTTTTTTTSS